VPALSKWAAKLHHGERAENRAMLRAAAVAYFAEPSGMAVEFDRAKF